MSAPQPPVHLGGALQLSAKEGETLKLDGAINPADLLPADRAYYAFMGSLTTPPCSEEVRWQVLKTPVELSASRPHSRHASRVSDVPREFSLAARPVDHTRTHDET